MDKHAQQEIRDYALAMFDMVKMVFPISSEAFEDYRLETVSLTRLEIEALKNKSKNINSSNKRESEEWKRKIATLGLDDGDYLS